VRDRETIGSELRLLAAVRWSIREHGASRRVVRSTNGSNSGPDPARRESGVLERSITKRVVRYSCPPRCFLKLSVSESQLSGADYPRPTGRKVP
jgi:hypothetical protein